MTPEEIKAEADNRYPIPTKWENMPFVAAQTVRNESFIEGANWMAEENYKWIDMFRSDKIICPHMGIECQKQLSDKDKEIARLNRGIDRLNNNFNIAEEEAKTQIAALKADIEKERWIPVSERLPTENDAGEFGQIEAWRTFFKLNETINYNHLIIWKGNYSHWKPINPPQ